MAKRYLTTITLAIKNKGIQKISDAIAEPITSELFNANNLNQSWLYKDVNVSVNAGAASALSPSADSTGAKAKDTKANTAVNAKYVDIFARNIKRNNRVIKPMKLNNEFIPASMAKDTASAIWEGLASEFKILSNLASKVSTRSPCLAILSCPLVYVTQRKSKFKSIK